MKTNTYPIGFFALCMIIVVMAGCAKMQRNRGDYYYDNFAYAKAIPFYKKALKYKNDPLVEARLADSNRKVSKPADGTAVCIGPPDTTKPACDLLIVENLVEMGDKDEARGWLVDYLKFTPDDRVAQNRLLAIDSTDAWKKDSDLVVIQALNSKINTPDGSNFSPVYYDNGIAFVSERKFDPRTGKADWTGRNYLDIFSAKKTSGGDWAAPTAMKGKLNGPFYEGPMSFSRREDTVWFTRTNFQKRKLGKSSDKVNNLEMYYSVKRDDKWNKPTSFDHNNNEYSTGHPALSHDGRTLYFVSDMPGGFGGTDIYECQSVGGGKWSAPRNLGKTINTPGNEMFPYITKEDDMYFASNGQATMGGLDIFSSHLSGNTWSPPVNMRYPINTIHDDFSFIVNPKDSTGFLSSPRDNTDGIDKIYTFKILGAPRPEPVVAPYCPPPIRMIEGRVVSKQTHTPISSAKVELLDSAGHVANKMKSNGDGTFSFPLDSMNAYKLSAIKEGFFFSSMSMRSAGSNVFVTLELDSLEMGKAIVIEDIYYDFDKWNIRADAQPPLDHIIDVMRESPKIQIELSSHTDSRGSSQYNQNLSQHRAESAVAYLRAHGIAANRVVAKGYGEAKLINSCADGVECSEEDHQLNRRTEFKVIGKDK